MKKLSLVLGLALSLACYRKPPVVNGRHREPVNDAERQERLSFCATLGQKPPQAPAPPHQREASPATPAVMPPASATSAPSASPATSAASPASAAVVPLPPAPAPGSSYLMRVHFAWNSAAFHPTTEQVLALRPHLVDAARIEVRGRTDGPTPHPADERVALARALAAKHFLVSQGVDPRRIVLNFVSGAEYVADNTTAEGRAENRRVEIEVFGGAR